MKNLLLFLALFITYYGSSGQTYNPTNFTISNKAYGIAQAAPTDARSYFYDASLFIQRPYQSTAEVLSYLNLAKYRVGQFPIYVSSGTLQSGGTFAGGAITEYWFKDGTANINLVKRDPSLIQNIATAFVDTTGNNSLALKGSPFLPFKTIDAALDAFPTGNCTIIISSGRYAAPTPSKIHSFITFVGAGRGIPNNTNSFTHPTGISTAGGTIIEGNFDIPRTSQNIKIIGIGVDVGETVVNTKFSGVPQQGLTFSTAKVANGSGNNADHNFMLQVDSTLRKGMEFRDILVVGSSNSAIVGVHLFLGEDCEGEIVENIMVCWGYAGLVRKTINGKWNNLVALGCGSYGIIPKSDDYARCEGGSITNFYIGSYGRGTDGNFDGRGLMFYSGQVGNEKVKGVKVSNGYIYRTTLFGVGSQGNPGVENVSIENVTIDSCTHSGFVMSGVINSVISGVKSNFSGTNGFDLSASKGTIISNLSSTHSGQIGFVLYSPDSTLSFSNITSNENNIAYYGNPGEVKGCGYSAKGNLAIVGSPGYTYSANCLPDIPPTYADTYSGRNADSIKVANASIFVGDLNGTNYPPSVGSSYTTALNLLIAGNPLYVNQIRGTYDNGLFFRNSVGGAWREDQRFLLSPKGDSSGVVSDSILVYSSASKNAKKLAAKNKFNIQPVVNVNYTANINDQYIGVRGIASNETITFPTTSNFTGQHILVKDETNSASYSNTITVTPVESYGVINSAGGFREFVFDGSVWKLLRKDAGDGFRSDFANSIDGEDLNTIRANGLYVGSSLSNAPGGSGGLWYIEVINHSTDWQYQHATAFGNSGNSEYYRTKVGGTWQAWILKISGQIVTATNGTDKYFKTNIDGTDYFISTVTALP